MDGHSPDPFSASSDRVNRNGTEANDPEKEFLVHIHRLLCSVDIGKLSCENGGVDKMRTIQEYLREADREKLIDEYLRAHPIDYNRMPEEYLDLPVRQVRETYKEKLNGYIDHLCSIDPVEPENGKHGILYVCRCIGDYGSNEPCFCLTYLEDLKDDPAKAEDYAYEYSPQEEIMGYLVSDSPLTKRYIYELMADVMFEASFFGYRNEHLKEEIEELDRRIKDLEEDKAQYISLAETFPDWDGMDTESSDEKELHDCVYNAVSGYSNHSREKERKLILESLPRKQGRNKQSLEYNQ